MDSVIMCRVCLTDVGQMYDIENTKLQSVFEELIKVPFNIAIINSNLLCGLCHYELRRCLKLKDRAAYSNTVLTQLALSDAGVTKQSLSQINRNIQQLKYNLVFSPIELVSITETVLNNDDLKEEVEAEFNTVEDMKEEMLKNENANDCAEDNDSDNDVNGDDLEKFQFESEDDVPLKVTQVKKEKRSRKKTESTEVKSLGLKIDNFEEVLLTKEEQIAEVRDRANSLNYRNCPYKCDACFKGFIDDNAFQNHMYKHDEAAGAHACGVCSQRYGAAGRLRAHVRSAHARRYRCTRCSLTVHTAHQAREHVKWHAGHTYTCEICTKQFTKLTSYLTHRRVRHADGAHVCRACGEAFVGPYGLALHAAKAHSHRDQQPTPEDAQESYCAPCDIQFSNTAARQRHVMTSSKHRDDDLNTVPCGVCGRSVRARALRAHVRRHARAACLTTHIACEKCGDVFPNRSRLHSHEKRVHLGIKSNRNVVCEQCGKKWTSVAALKYHQRTHTGERPYACSACAARFPNSNQLRLHTRTHTGERPYECTACGKRFSQKPSLNRHKRVHTGDKPYECTYCAKTFSQLDSLKKHIKAVHLKIPPKPKKNKIKQETVEKKKDGVV